ncbi:MAG: Pr6Pr family membrane protein [Stenotrophomonas maltophilia]
MTRPHSDSVAPTTPPALRAWAGLTAVVAVAALLLQYHLLLRTPGLGAGAATLRYLGYFTILSNMGVAAVCLALARGRRDGLAGPVPRAAVALFIGITGVIYVTILRPLWHPQGAQWWADSGLHYAVPVLYLLGWVAGPHGGLHRRGLLGALAFPAVYLGWALLVGRLSGQYPYPFLDLDTLGIARVARNALAVGVVFVVSGGLLWGLDAALAARRRHR